MTLRFLAATAFALTLAACGDSTAPTVSNGVLSATFEATGLRLANSGDEKLYYLVTVAGTLAQFAGCNDPATCPAVEAHGSRLVPWTEVFPDGSERTEYAVYSWRLVRASSGNYEPVYLEILTARR